MKKDRSKERTAAYRIRLSEKKASAAEERETAADDIAIRNRMCYFGEVTPRINARTHAEELAIHREFLRCLRAPDVQPGENLRDVARRTWAAWTKGTIHDDPDAVYCPGFNRNTQRWEFCEGFGVNKVFVFDEIWVPPSDCRNGEENLPIDINHLPPLPPAPTKPEVKHVVERTAVEPQDFVYPTPPPKSDFGTYGLSRTSHL